MTPTPTSVPRKHFQEEIRAEEKEHHLNNQYGVFNSNYNHLPELNNSPAPRLLYQEDNYKLKRVSNQPSQKEANIPKAAYNQRDNNYMNYQELDHNVIVENDISSNTVPQNRHSPSAQLHTVPSKPAISFIDPPAPLSQPKPLVLNPQVPGFSPEPLVLNPDLLFADRLQQKLTFHDDTDISSLGKR